ncbi:MAG: hypothetical protein SNH13_07565 [Rikenellaceae bacterium]
MKKLKLIFVAALMLASTIALQAQPRQQQRVSKEDFPKFQLQMLIRQLLIEEPKREAFSKIYMEYSKELEALRAPRKEQPKGEVVAPSDAEIEKQILASFEAAEKSTALKKKYYTKFKEVLTPQQILKMYKVERTAHDRIMSKSRSGDAPRGKGRPQGEQPQQERE